MWHFDVAKNFLVESPEDEVSLEFRGLESIPQGAEVYLVDWRLDRLVDVRENPRFSFYLGKRTTVIDDADARFTLIVASEDFIDGSGAEVPPPPTRTVLHRNYPNPFTPGTIIRYDVAGAGEATLTVYDVAGTLVRVLVQGHRDSGRYEIRWDGRNGQGERVGSGLYFYRLEAPGGTQTRKMIMLR